jgi:hypothetical protein
VIRLKQLEKKFNEDMMKIYTTAKKELKYNASRFLQMISCDGGLQTAKKLIAKKESAEGFEVLWLNGRLDLSVEAHVLKPEYSELFTEEEKNICSERLKKVGYNID